MEVLIVPDKFKGTLSAAEAARAIAAGWRSIRPDDRLAIMPMSDGGDGFGPVLGQMLGAREESVQTVDAAHRRIAAAWWWSAEGKLAVIETARVNGLAMLPPGRFHPFELDTFGLGAVFREALDAGAVSCVAGIGGSATNDGGFGLARGLGYRFFRDDGTEVTQWTDLQLLDRIEIPPRMVRFREMTIATDVQNPLLGADGATRVYGPQKGVLPEDYELAEGCLGRLTEVVKRELGIDAAAEPGSGAAGGLGYGLRVFLNGKFRPGFEIFADHGGLESKIKNAGLVITAEGSIDRSSWMGKGTGAVAVLARKHGKRCIGLAGIAPAGASERNSDKPLFHRVYAIHPDVTSLEQARERPAHWLEQLAARAALEY